MPSDHADPHLTDAGVYGMVISLIATTLKRLGAICLAFVLLWHLARHSDVEMGKAIVHAPRAGLLVSIDNRTYRINSLADSPVVCELSPGVHMVQVRRDELLLGEEDFTVAPGRDVAVFPLRHPPAAPAAVSSQRESPPPSQSARPESLAVRIRTAAEMDR
jgi:hypothetical protein